MHSGMISFHYVSIHFAWAFMKGFLHFSLFSLVLFIAVSSLLFLHESAILNNTNFFSPS